MTGTTVCAHGCTTTGQHTTGCTDPRCRGCLPRTATTGHLCAWCRSRLELDVADAPRMVHHLRWLATPYAGATPPDATGARHIPASTVLIADAVDAADDLHALLHAWANLIADERTLRGPSHAGVRMSVTRIATFDGTAYLQPGVPVGVTKTTATLGVARWLLPHLDYAAHRPWISDMRRELATTLAGLHARYPTTDDIERAHIVDVPCPRCDARTLTYTPPSWHRAAFRVECTNPDCAKVFSEDEWDRFKAWVLFAGRAGA
jgi:hypothetical protein